MIKTFVKKPVKIQAVQWTGENYDEIRDFIGRDNANLIEHSEDPDFGHSYSRG